jgi:hypothetical protein
MIRIPKPLRDDLLSRLTASIAAGVDEIIEATDADSDGGRKITRAERKLIARKVYEAALKLPAVGDES